MNPWVLSATLLFAFAAVLWLRKGYLLSPFLAGIGGFLLTCGFNIRPILSTEANTPLGFSSATMWVMNATALVYALFAVVVPTNRHTLSFSVRTRFASIRTIVVAFAFVCLVSLAKDIRDFGTLPIFAKAQTFGTEYYFQYGELGFLTFAGWSAGTAAFTLFTLDYCSSKMSLYRYIDANKVIAGAVALCAFCNLASGYRYTLVGKVVIFGAIYELCHRVRLTLVAGAIIVVSIFFIIFGNYRSNAVRIEDKLKASANFGVMANALAWTASYSEPNLQNLENFIKFAPEPVHGDLLIASVTPSILHSDLGIERYSSATFMGTYQLYAHHGLSFRTFYPDFMMDFGVAGGTVFGAGLLLFCFLIFCLSFSRPQLLVAYALLGPALFGVPLLNEFTKLYTLVPFGLYCLVSVQSRRNEAMGPRLPKPFKRPNSAGPS